MAQGVTAASLLAVWVGGTVGTALRVAVTPDRALTAFPVATFLVNVVGAGLFGLLVERLARRPADRRRPVLGLLLGTGLLGGFTTYSALAVDCVQLVRNGATAAAVAYALGTLLVGGVASWAGVRLGRSRT